MAEWKEKPAGSGRWRKQLWHLGKPVMLTFHGTKADAEQYEAGRRIELGAQDPRTRGSVLAFESFCADHYKPHAKATLRPSTWKVRRFYLEHLVLHFGRITLPKIWEPEIESYKLKRLSTAASKVTINSELSVLGTALTYARETLKLPCSNPKIKKFAVRARKDKVACWTQDEAAHILATAKAHASWFHPLFLFMFETGVRKSETVSLAWKRVDFAKKIVRIWSDDEEGYEVKSKEREVPLSDHLVTVLKEQKLRWASDWVFPCVTSRFEGERGEKMAEFPDASWRRIVTLAGLTGGPHKARHTFASLFLQAKPDLFLLGRLLGHSHSRVTELYSHLLPEHLASARGVVSFAPSPAPAKTKKPSAKITPSTS